MFIRYDYLLLAIDRKENALATYGIGQLILPLVAYLIADLIPLATFFGNSLMLKMSVSNARPSGTLRIGFAVTFMASLAFLSKQSTMKLHACGNGCDGDSAIFVACSRQNATMGTQASRFGINPRGIRELRAP